MIKSRRQLVEFLTQHKYIKTGGSKHEKWSKGEHSIFIPRHSKKFSIYLGNRIAKEILNQKI